MFFHAHLYFTQKIFNSKIDDLLVIGSILPDIAVTKIVDWNELHKSERVERFEEFVKENNQKYLPLIKGIKSHIVLDNFTHKSYKNGTGYAFQKSPPLINLASECCGIDKKSAKKAAHNFIEIAVDILLLKDDPDLVDILKKSIKSCNKSELSKLLSSFFKKDKDAVFLALSDYFEVILRYNLSNIDGWVSLWADINNLLYSKKIDKCLTSKTIIKATHLVKNSYLEFLEDSITVAKDSLVK